MFKFLRKKKAQSTVEYAVLIIIIIGALLTIQIYIKRGIQGRLRTAADDIGEQFSPGGTNVYTEVSMHSRRNEVYDTGVSTSTLLDAETTNMISSSNIINQYQEYWGT